MSTPSQKNDEMEQELQRLFGFDRREAILADRCVPAPVGCGGPALEFPDEESRQEYTISGLCAACQRKVWGDGTEPCGECGRLATLDNDGLCPMCRYEGP
jgi:hypothetical protein